MTLHRFEETTEPHYGLIMLGVVIALLGAISIAFLAFVSLHGGV